MPQTVYAVFGEQNGTRYCLGVYNLEAEANNRASLAKDYEATVVRSYELGTDVADEL